MTVLPILSKEKMSSSDNDKTNTNLQSVKNASSGDKPKFIAKDNDARLSTAIRNMPDNVEEKSGMDVDDVMPVKHKSPKKGVIDDDDDDDDDLPIASLKDFRNQSSKLRPNDAEIQMNGMKALGKSNSANSAPKSAGVCAPSATFGLPTQQAKRPTMEPDARPQSDNNQKTVENKVSLKKRNIDVEDDEDILLFNLLKKSKKSDGSAQSQEKVKPQLLKNISADIGKKTGATSENIKTEKKPQSKPVSKAPSIAPTPSRVVNGGSVKSKSENSTNIPASVSEISVKKEKSRTKVTPPVKKEEKKVSKNAVSVKEEASETEEESLESRYRFLTDENFDDSVKWTSLHHSGVLFPPEYVPHGIPLIYNGSRIKLPPELEEIATFYAAVIGTAFAENPTFNKNFFHDWRKLISKSSFDSVIKQFEKCDFTLIAAHLTALKDAKKLMSKEEKEKLKKEKEAQVEKYGFCFLDGRKEKVGNFRIEPPGLFRGRGDHPKTGCIKQRVRPEQVTINLSEDAPIPTPPAGSNWLRVVSENTRTWLANWTENVNGEIKYVFLAASSSLKGQSDFKKFEKARQLKGVVEDIRSLNKKELTDKDESIRQRATALWLIDHLALRAGNEKGDDEADTVGCCSLRVEHIKLEEPDTVIFDFLGKDSIRYFNTVTVPEVIFKNLKRFVAPPKKPADSIFETLTTSSLNGFLNKLMPGLTAKVFRTFNASHTFERELELNTQVDDGVSIHDKQLSYNRANRQVAILCNHQRAVPKTHATSIGKLKDKVMAMKYERFLVKKAMRSNSEFKSLKKKNPNTIKDVEEVESDMEGNPTAIKEEAKKLKEREEEKNAQLIASGKSPKKGALPDYSTFSMDRLRKKLDSLNARIKASKIQLIDKDENKMTALGTSKINYIDPRITVAWCRRHNVPIDKMFNKSLQEKFQWAMTVSADWKF